MLFGSLQSPESDSIPPKSIGWTVSLNDLPGIKLRCIRPRWRLRLYFTVVDCRGDQTMRIVVPTNSGPSWRNLRLGIEAVPTRLRNQRGSRQDQWHQGQIVSAYDHEHYIHTLYLKYIGNNSPQRWNQIQFSKFHSAASSPIWTEFRRRSRNWRGCRSNTKDRRIPISPPTCAKSTNLPTSCPRASKTR